MQHVIKTGSTGCFSSLLRRMCWTQDNTQRLNLRLKEDHSQVDLKNSTQLISLFLWNLSFLCPAFRSKFLKAELALPSPHPHSSGLLLSDYDSFMTHSLLEIILTPPFYPEVSGSFAWTSYQSSSAAYGSVASGRTGCRRWRPGWPAADMPVWSGLQSWRHDCLSPWGREMNIY